MLIFLTKYLQQLLTDFSMLRVTLTKKNCIKKKKKEKTRKEIKSYEGRSTVYIM